MAFLMYILSSEFHLLFLNNRLTWKHKPCRFGKRDEKSTVDMYVVTVVLTHPVIVRSSVSKKKKNARFVSSDFVSFPYVLYCRFFFFTYEHPLFMQYTPNTRFGIFVFLRSPPLLREEMKEPLAVNRITGREVIHARSADRFSITWLFTDRIIDFSTELSTCNASTFCRGPM